MSAFAAVMTGRGMGAIATIQLIGDAAPAVLANLLRRAGDQPLELATGRIFVGHVVDGDEVIDQVTVGCEGPDTFAIHCHGNPLVVERIVRLSQRNGVELLTAEEMLTKLLAAQPFSDTIAAEARLALATVKTIAGAEILAHQIEFGLSAQVTRWRQELDRVPLSQVSAEAQQILRNSEPARLMISGCTIALIGPPNTGKSTLLNTLAGREKAVVTDIPGTTRDWVSAEIHIPPLAATIIDTAGIDPMLSDGIDRTAQNRSVHILEQVEVVLLVLDVTQSASQFDRSLADRLTGKRVVTVLNKSDLPGTLDPASLPAHFSDSVRVSARQGTGIDELIRAIHRVCGLPELDYQTPVAFTDRQCKELEQLRGAVSVSEAAGIIEELILGQLVV